jgi:GT2 family glycosyltransferase
MHITVVTITNRKRWHLLHQTLTAAFAEGIDRAVVIDNAADEDIATKMRESFRGAHRTIRLEKNQGPAGAYFTGIGAALDDGAEYLLLLDDDNLLKPGAVHALKSAYQAQLANCSHSGLCVSAYRPEQEWIRGDRPNSAMPSPNRYLGFHLKDLALGIWRRRPGAERHRQRTQVTQPFRRAIAPWGGLLFHRALIERFGYPNPEFVLYWEDIEFTMRVTCAGGEIWVIPAARIDDLESSWTKDSRRIPYVHTLIHRGSDEQVYYQVRNRAYLETRRGARSWIRQINRRIFFARLRAVASRAGRIDRLKLVTNAVRDGEKGKLGLWTPPATRDS